MWHLGALSLVCDGGSMWQGAIRRRTGGSREIVMGGGGVRLAVSGRRGRDKERVYVPSTFWACVGQVWVRETWLGTRPVRLGYRSSAGTT